MATEGQIKIDPIRTSAEIDKIAGALSKAQGEMKHPGKKKTAKVPLKNGGSYSYDYADLTDCLDAIRQPFANHGLAMIQIPFHNEPRVVGVVTRIMHESGQWIEGTLHVSVDDGRPQAVGTGITYGRRYMISPMAGIASDDDDDGNLVQGNDADTGQKQGLQSSGNASPITPNKTVVAPNQDEKLVIFDFDNDEHMNKLDEILCAKDQIPKGLYKAIALELNNSAFTYANIKKAIVDVLAMQGDMRERA